MTSLLHTVDQVRVAQETAAWLQRWRRNQGLSQRKAALVAGVTRNTFANWERGRTVPMLFQVQRLKAFATAKARPKGLKISAKAGGDERKHG